MGISAVMEALDWKSLFEDACSGEEDILHWGLPEPWVQTQLFGALERRRQDTGWQVLKNEVPYITHIPVDRPKHRDIATEGAVKWVDLCLVSEELQEFCWFELKVRHTGLGERKLQAAKDAQACIKKDVSALVGMNVELTHETWIKPDQYTVAHWFPDVLGYYLPQLRNYRHSFVMAYLQLFGALDETLLNKTAITSSTRKWVAGRNKQDRLNLPMPELDIELFSEAVAGKHSLSLVSWTL